MGTYRFSHSDKIVFAEITAVVGEVSKRKYDELQARYAAGDLTHAELADALASLFSQQSALLERYELQQRDSGHVGLADALDAWGEKCAEKSSDVEAALSQGEIDTAVSLALGVADNLKNNIQLLDKIDKYAGKGCGSVVSRMLQYAKPIQVGYSVTEAVADFFAGENKAGASALVGLAIGLGVSSLVMSAVAVDAVPIVVAVSLAVISTAVADVLTDVFDEVATMFGWESPAEAKEAVLEGLGTHNNVYMPHVGDHLYWGAVYGEELLASDDEPSDMVGAGGDDTVTGASKDDYLNGGEGNDELRGRGGADWLVGDVGGDALKGGGGDDRVEGGAGVDTLDGGAGNDTLKGGLGSDAYEFSLAELTAKQSTNVIADADGDGAITIDGTALGSMPVHEYLTSEQGTLAWQASDYKYTFTWSPGSNSLIITVAQSGSRIVIRDWQNGDLGISLPDFDETNPPQSAPLTNGNDVFGRDGNNAVDDYIKALGGNDGISAGSGADVIAGGDGVDLIYGGSGDDHLSGGADGDLILDDSEWTDMQDWSDEIGPDGKSQREHAQERIAELGASVVASGKGWYVYTTSDGDSTTYIIVTAGGYNMLDPNQAPSGSDTVSGGLGDDVIWTGEGNDVIQGNVGADYIDGGADADVIYGNDGADQIFGDTPSDLVAEGDPTSIISDNAQKNGNDVIYGGAGNDSINGTGGDDAIQGGDGADVLRGNGNGQAIGATAPDDDQIAGGQGNDVIFGDDGDDTVRGGDNDDTLAGDDPAADTRYGRDWLYGDKGNDSVFGGGSDDVLHGGVGSDTLFGDTTQVDGSHHGADILYGGDGNDTVVGGGDSDMLLGGNGDDELAGDNAASVLDVQYDGDDYLDGGDGKDSLFGYGGDDDLFGGDDADVLQGGKDGDFLSGGNAADQLIGDEGNDNLSGGVGNDTMWGSAGNDTVTGGSDDDFVMGDAPETDVSKQGDDFLEGGIGNDTLLGKGGNDTAYGGLGSDQVQGGAGLDALSGSDGNDLMFGGTGNDSVNGGAGVDTLHGGAGDDSLVGGAGNDMYIGGFGTNAFTVAPGDGDDLVVAPPTSRPTGTVLGGVLHLEGGLSPADVSVLKGGNALKISYDGGSVVIQNYFDQYDPSLGGGGYGGGTYYNFSPVTSIVFADGSQWSLVDVKLALIQPSAGNDVITGFDNAETISGAAGDDSIQGMGGADVLSGDVGNDTLEGGTGLDQLSGGAGDDSLRGGLDADDLQGGAGSDALYGDAGNDSLTGGTGDDQLDGGDGNDVYVFASGAGHDTISNDDAGQGRVDTLQFAQGISTADVTARRVGDDLLLEVAGSNDAVTVQNYFRDDAAGAWRLDGVTFADGTTWDVDTIKQLVLTPTDGNDSLQGYAGDDVISGAAGNDTLLGNAGNDQLTGAAGDDSLMAGDGADILSGGAGDDMLQGGAGQDSLDGGAGADTLQAGNDNDVLSAGAGVDLLQAGAGADTLSGGDGDDNLQAGGGADSLNGGIGADTLQGGMDADRYVFAPGEGKDTIIDADGLSTLQFAGVVNDDLVMRRDGTALVIHYDSDSADEVRIESFFDASTGLALGGLQIVGDTSWTLSSTDVDAHVMQGAVGDDVIYGNINDNVIDALDGQDTVHAGAGSDSVDGGDGNDALLGEAGMDTLAGGLGNDDLHGGDGADELHGGSGDDLIAGDAGSDQMAGGAGNDTYLVDDAGDGVAENVNEGTDTIRSSVSYTAPGHVENIELTGNDAINATGNALGNQLTGNSGANQLAGMAGHDVLLGQAGADVLVAGAGNDMLDGGSGADGMSGGVGDDTYLVDNANDTVVENPGEGLDVVKASSDYTLSGHVEKLVLVEGSYAYDGTGNADENTLVGNSRGNTLDGGAGADTLIGGTGDDAYLVDNAGDTIVEQTGQGDDTVRSSIGYTLGGTLENLTLLGTANLDGAGNDRDNQLIGNAGNNRLDGGLGADVMTGGQGDDYYLVDASGDRVHESDGGGNDTLERHYDTNLVLAGGVENLILADGITTGNGNSLDNTVTGNAVADTLAGLAGSDTVSGLAGDDALFGSGGGDHLDGGEGNDYLDGGAAVDTLTGGAGSDTYIVGQSGDVVVEQAGAGTDQAQATASYVLAGHVENLFLMNGSGAINGSGNALANYMAGNGAANVIEGKGGNDTLVDGAGVDQLVGGTGDDKYVLDADSGTDLIDNSDGGFDGIFFANNVTRDQLTFARDGDDLLIFVDGAAQPAARVTNHFLGGDAAIDYVQPANGYDLTTAEINQIVAANQGGGDYDQVIEGTSVGEQLVGGSGKDLVKGLAGGDQLFGMAGDDKLLGGDGDDYVAGGNGSGTGSGDDHLEGGAGADTLTGEDGTNVLIGGAGDDSYVYGGGQDTIDTSDGGHDGIFFNNGITVDNLTFTQDGNDLVITVNGDAAETVRVTDHFLSGAAAIDYVQPASGPLLDTAAINALVGTGDSGGDDNPPPGGGGNYDNVVDGTSAAEQLLGTAGTDLIHGLGGNDTVFGFGGDDKFVGGDGDDYLSGGNGSFSGSGDDILVGGAGVDTLVGEDGTDTLMGGAGNDKYIWQAGSGSDVIDNTGGGTDWLFFNGVDRTRLGFHQDGNDLVIMVDGDPSRQVRVQDQFLGGDAAISYVQPSDGYAIPASQFDSLLTPMPQTAAQGTPASTDLPDSFALQATAAFGASTPALSATDLRSLWHLPYTDGSPWTLWRNDHITSREPQPIRLGVVRQDAPATPSLQRLIEAMASFHPSSAAELEPLGLEGSVGAAMGSPYHSARRLRMEQRMQEPLQL